VSLHKTGRPLLFKPREKPECFHEEAEVRTHPFPKAFWFKFCTKCKDVEWLC
jgi:hypothetical protein